MPLRTLPLLAASLAFLAGCSCGESPAPAPPGGVTLDLLARRPDALFELPVIEPVGDVPGTLTWGTSEGGGWDQTDLRLPGGVPYLVTNQATASLLLPAPRPAERELLLVLWCTRPIAAEPARVRVRLNGVELVAGGLAVGREPAELRVHAPEPAWRLGENLLELELPESHGAWDTLALARVSYGPEARVGFEPPGTLQLVDGTGARYLLALAEGALVELAGTASGPGRLLLRAGVLDPRTGELTLEESASDAHESSGGALAAALPLTPRPGLVRALELEWRSPGGAALSLGQLTVHERASRVRPPIVFVSIDTFAARHMAMYGYARHTTPELERFQRDAIRFERCLANAPWTLPSYLSVLSGLYPRAHHANLREQAGADLQPHDWWQLAPNRWTLAEALRARGYRTAGFVDTQWLAPKFGVAQGFDLYNGLGALAPFEDPTQHIQRIVEELVPPWLAQADPEHPPFLFLHALDAHGPYLPNEPFRDTFVKTLTDERTLVPAGSDNQTYRWMPWWMSRTTQPDERLPEAARVPLEEVVARYDESLLKVDAYLGKLFTRLRACGLYDEAVIVVTGDHGEYFGPGMYGHGLMREAVLHVPLLVKLPGSARGGEVVQAPVELVDVYPTLLELAGVPADPARVHGQSLLAPASAAADERVLYSEGGHVEQYALTRGCWRLVEEFPGSESSVASLLSHPRVPDEWLRLNAPELLVQPLTKDLLRELLARADFGARVAELRRLVAGPYRALYDLCRDPAEQHDLAAQEPEVLAQLLRALEAHKARARAAQAEARPSAVRTGLTPEALRDLEALGYGGAAPDEPPGSDGPPAGRK